MKKTLLSGAIAIVLLYTTNNKTFAQADWHITGNSGTAPSTNFLGTTDKKGLSFKTNNAERIRITAAGNVGIGVSSAVQKLDVNGNINIGAGSFLFMDNHKVLRIDSVKGNTFLGNNVGDKNISSYNTAIGFQSLFSNTSGGYNTASGYQALYKNYAGFYNTATGMLSLYSNTTGSYNSAYGTYALMLNSTGYNNTANGYNALFSNSTGYSNTAQGYSSLYNNTTGIENVAAGKYALYKNSTGNYNTALGTEALYLNTAGYNTATGYRALFANTTGYDNAAFGAQGLLSNTTGIQNTATGINALYSNIYGSYNTALGAYALFNTSYSSNNTAVGDIAGSSYQNGWNNTFIGAFADATGPDIYNSIAIGNSSRVSAPNQVRIGNSSTTSIGGYAGWSTISDGRVKKNIKDNVPGLAFINKLKAVTYNIDLAAADKFLQTPGIKQKDVKPQELSKADIAAHEAKQKVVYTGFIAQDVERAAKELEYNFSGVDAAKNDKDLYSLRYAEFVVPLVKAVQELSQQNEELRKRIEKLETQNTAADASAITSKNITLTDASLSQNTPNPFKGATTIHYILPQQYSAAKIVVTDNNGKTIKEINIAGNGKGSVVIDASSIASGAYNYSLYINGKQVQSKKMLLNK